MKYFLVILIAISFSQACKKQSADPATPQPQNAQYSLVSSGGNCSNTTINGSYTSGSALAASNTITVQLSVTAPGKYKITTPVVNGFSFADSGTFISTGSVNLILKGTGTPNIAGTAVFPISSTSNSCSISVQVGAPASGGEFPDNDHMYLGNPSGAAFNTDSIKNFLLRRTYYALSYNNDRGIPNWVSWHLYSPDLGATPRQDDFRPDNDLPATFYKVPANAYSGSGFDRGHNVPSADRTSSIPANSSTFLMTNMIPQAPTNNQQTWARMEDSLRRLVNMGYELYIIMGNYGEGGSGSNGSATTIHSGLVTVPAFIWKVAVVLADGNNDSARITTGTRIIAVIVPNTNSVNTNWKTYRSSVDAIEAATGLDLLTRLPVSLQNVLEAKVDNL